MMTPQDMYNAILIQAPLIVAHQHTSPETAVETCKKIAEQVIAAAFKGGTLNVAQDGGGVPSVLLGAAPAQGLPQPLPLAGALPALQPYQGMQPPVQPIPPHAGVQTPAQAPAHTNLPLHAATPVGTNPILAAAMGLPAQGIPGQVGGPALPGQAETPLLPGAGQVVQQAQPQEIGGTTVVPPAGQTFQPPAPVGAMNTMTQAPTPQGAQGQNAFGTTGVISQPIIRPHAGQPDVVVSPGNERVVTQVGGQGGTTFVPETVGR
jgi:hypothetical protein